jgi:hypothetical protein
VLWDRAGIGLRGGIDRKPDWPAGVDLENIIAEAQLSRFEHQRDDVGLRDRWPFGSAAHCTFAAPKRRVHNAQNASDILFQGAERPILVDDEGDLEGWRLRPFPRHR